MFSWCTRPVLLDIVIAVDVGIWRQNLHIKLYYITQVSQFRVVVWQSASDYSFRASHESPWSAVCPLRKPNRTKLITRLDCKACNLWHIPASSPQTHTYTHTDPVRSGVSVSSQASSSHLFFHVSCPLSGCASVYRNIDLRTAQRAGTRPLAALSRWC